MLPDWFLLRPAPDMDIKIDINEWVPLAEQRVNFLIDFSENPEQAIRKYRQMPNFNMQKQFLGHLLLRLVAAKISRVRSWFVETEGDLFGHYFRNSNSLIKREIAEQLFEGHIKLLPELRREYSEDEIWFFQRISRTEYDKYISVYFSKVPWLVSSRKIDLSSGWVIISWKRFQTTVKHKYERNLRQKIIDLAPKIEADLEVDRVTRHLQPRLLDYIQLQGEDDEGLHFQLDTTTELVANFEYYPPCMAYLQQEFEITRYLTHSKRLQLGWFLKRIGMDIEQQIQFWWEKSADNVGKSFENFMRKSGYQIRHIYGLTGARTDYDVPKCQTCISRYFCAFAHLPKDKLKSFLLRTYGSLKVLPNWPEIKNFFERKRPQDACTELCLKIFERWPYRRRIAHPLQWTRVAYDNFKNQQVSIEETSED
ncbi:MAG: hypothetical protein ACFFBD_01215 [Candidatus Hodarchaeota archaeon]